MSKISTKDTIKRRTIDDMKALGIHKPQYNRLIDIYARLVHEYLKLSEEFEKSGSEYQTFTAAGGAKKSPIVATLESLRKDIISYSDRLCLNPKSLESVTAEKESNSKLASLLKDI
ncbi:P27 family phage terminase small subunit [Jeotgalibacillus sp. S-D1]|uniref:P27 family phage terminase small subunit n=1 Tax=Jeotgalibacillus sp. S-D1 TaxID=2552189 RepID=UPI0010595E87|nr:P27 family phage terminase small subunit [Jeotgalibacillus sp. S-D1]TDL34568.1 P27 family phage terminase small subunit [Jeotgalibacillus sp. S-D1]